MTRKPHPPEWLFLLALCAVSALAELGFVIVNISALPVFLKFGLHLPNLPGIALAAYYLVEALANSPMGALADRLGRRRLMVMGTCLSIVTCLATSQIHAPEGRLVVLGVTALILLLRAFDGMGAAMLWPNVYASVADRVAPERRAQANTLITIAYMAMIPLGLKLGGWLNENFGRNFTASEPGRYIPSFLFAAGCFAATSLLAYIVAPRRDAQRTPEEESENAPVSKSSLMTAIHQYPWLLALIFLIFIAIGLIAPYVKPYFMERFGIAEETFGNLTLGPAVLIGVLSAPLGKLVDKWGKPQAIKLGTALCAGALWGLLFATHQNMIVVFGTVLGIGFVMSFPAYMAFVSEMAPESERGGMIGAVRMAQGVGAMLGSVLSSPLYTADSQHHTIFYLASGILTLGFVLSLVVVKAPTKTN
ncbi:MAG: MFS transporter [Armatimonadetes bacterium]|nr:MFS transporter [Armatimonadota bacterium]